MRPHQTAWLSPDWTDQASPEEIAIHGGPEAEEWLRRRPLSGAIAVGMARLGGLDAEYRSKRNATITSIALLLGAQPTGQQGTANGRLQRWPMGRQRCGQAAGTTEGQGSWP